MKPKSAEALVQWWQEETSDPEVMSSNPGIDYFMDFGAKIVDFFLLVNLQKEICYNLSLFV